MEATHVLVPFDGLRYGQFSLGPSREYVPSWTGEDAFRELYQNWRDGIFASFKLNPLTFLPQIRNTEDGIRITVYQMAPTYHLIAYIYYQKKTGRLIISNYSASLSMEDSVLGGTTMRECDKLLGLLGTHGKGFELATLVLVRLGYSVNILSGSFDWTFEVRNNILYRYSKALCRKNSVHFILEKIPEEVLRSWIKVAIDLDPPVPGTSIRSKLGDLILDNRLSGRIYHQGLLVRKGSSSSDRQYQYGYNFFGGPVNRDRERLSTPLEDARVIAAIWEDAMVAGHDVCIQKYLDLFYKDQVPDLALATQVISRTAAEILWTRLKLNSPGSFFYSDSGADNSAGPSDGDDHVSE